MKDKDTEAHCCFLQVIEAALDSTSNFTTVSLERRSCDTVQLVMDAGPLGAHCTCLGAAPGEEQVNVPGRLPSPSQHFQCPGFCPWREVLGDGVHLGHSSSASLPLNKPSTRRSNHSTNRFLQTPGQRYKTLIWCCERKDSSSQALSSELFSGRSRSRLALR